MKFVTATLFTIALTSLPYTVSAEAVKPAKPAPKAAATTTAAPTLYSPASCDFEIKFPEAYTKQNKCVDGACSEIISFAKTIKQSSVDFRLTCDAKTKDELTTIKNTDLKASAKELADNAGLKSYGEDTATLPDGTVSAVTIALGKRGDKDSIYTGQYWIGSKSLLTLEAEMRGPADKEIEKIYTDILGSVRVRPADNVVTKPSN